MLRRLQPCKKSHAHSIIHAAFVRRMDVGVEKCCSLVVLLYMVNFLNKILESMVLYIIPFSFFVALCSFRCIFLVQSF